MSQTTGFLPQRLDYPRVEDVNSAGFANAAPMQPGVSAPAGRAVAYVCTSAGTATFYLAGGSSIALPIAVGGFTVLPLSAIEVTLSSGAAGTFWCLS